MRHRLEMAAKAGMLADSALIAHGRGEAYDYLLGETTIPSAHDATMEALAH
jgi:4-phosphopantoate--beta-alanine ligase